MEPVAIVLISARVAETSQVEPILRHLLAKVGRSQQAIHIPFVSVRHVTGKERIDVLDCRRQSEQVERQPTYKRGSISLPRGGHSRSFEPGQDKQIDLV